MENQLFRRGGRVYILLIRYKVNLQTLERLRNIDQCLRGSCKAIITPHLHHINLSFTRGLQHDPILPAFSTYSRSMVDVIPGNNEAMPDDILPQGA
jgi:hypothetical protein